MNENIKLYHGDCLEMMKGTTDKSIDMILCDLPYSLKKRKTTWNDWDCEIDLEKLWSEYHRVIKDNGVIVLFGSDLFSAELITSNYKNYKYKWIWQKESGTGFLNAKRMPLRDFEEILVFYKKQPTYNPQMREGKPSHSKGKVVGKRNDEHLNNNTYGDFIVTENISDMKHPTSILQFAKPHSSIAIHPTQKPVDLLEYLINTYTNENEIVLDNCMGSGSTGVACINTNRKFIGIELDENYYNIAKNRIESVLSENG